MSDGHPLTYVCDSYEGKSCDEELGCVCDLAAEVMRLRVTLTGVIGVIDQWKVPLLDPDGRDCSEATMRLVADDLREFLK